MSNHDLAIIRKMLQYCAEMRDTHQYFHDQKEIFFDQRGGFVYRNSITMPILQIGELAKRLSAEFMAAHTEIPWRQIKGMRDIFAHHYGAVDFAFVWETAHADVTELAKTLEEAIANE
ncbi:MAG: DUF86 domain-containing protein [Planctomycetes bacterium]|nr:DUF86 domain-containing protein [Planctomycetota bacterium]